MKITFEPSVYDKFSNLTVSVSTPNDDLNIDEVVNLLKGALLAWGFCDGTVKERLGED